jgi:alkylation response protein AidB-like acyl-CoA dehydrogenase
MDFAFTDEQQMIAETAKAFFSENATSERTRAAMAADGVDLTLWQDFCQQLGFSGIGIAEERGGAGLGLVEMAIIAEAAGAQVAALPALGSLGLAAQAIAAGGSDAQREQWLGSLIAGEVIGAHVADGSIAERDGQLTGTARFVAHGSLAQVFYVDTPEGGWLVRADAPGVTITAQTTMDQTRPYARVELAGAACEPLADPAAARTAAHNAALVMIAAEGLGVAQAALDRTVAYSRDRVQFGRAIGSFQAYKHRLADMMVEIEQARSAVYWAACAVDEGSDDAALAVHSAKSFAADTAFRCASDMIQLHGGIGFTWEHDAHLFFKRARALQTMLGDGASHREEIARMILGEAA